MEQRCRRHYCTPAPRVLVRTRAVAGGHNMRCAHFAAFFGAFFAFDFFTGAGAAADDFFAIAKGE